MSYKEGWLYHKVAYNILAPQVLFDNATSVEHKQPGVITKTTGALPHGHLSNNKNIKVFTWLIILKWLESNVTSET